MATPHYCNPILESVGSSGNVATYKLLRFKGAPLGQRTLHRAFEMAAGSKKGPKNPKNTRNSIYRTEPSLQSA
jgi:hypothetical protein